MDEYPSNSKITKEEKLQAPTEEQQRRVEKVVEGKVIRQKKPLGRKFRDMFIGGDAKSVGEFVWWDVFVPAAKDTLADMMSQGVERMLFGETRSTSRRPYYNRGNRGQVSYNRLYSPNTPPWDRGRYTREESRPISRRARATHDTDEIILDTRTEAEEVMDRLFNLIEKYGAATVADLYDLVGATGSYTDDKYGWTTLPARDNITRVRNGYLLDLPRAEPLE